MSSLPAHLPAISRQHTGSTSHSTLAPAYERRLIRIASGIEAHDDQIPAEWRLQPYLDSVLPHYPDVEKVSNSEYRNHRQRVIFDLRQTTDKSVFRQWLETPELHVIYDGHARMGRGPCFGRVEEGAIQTEDWGEGNNRTTSGLFRMGFPFIGIDAAEILEHGYTAHLLKESEPIPASADCHPQLRPYLRSLHLYTPDQLHDGLAARLRNHQPGDRYWAYHLGREVKVIHHAGWQNTTSHPHEWAAVNVRCRVFCHLGCSSFLHNFPIVRRQAGWRREGNDRYAYWTTASSYPPTLALWIAHLISYNVENAFASWEPSLADTVTRTNRQLRAHGYSYRMI
jgi:hypothetical protein